MADKSPQNHTDAVTLAVMQRQLEDHIKVSAEALKLNDRQHEKIIKQQAEAMAFQNKLKIVSATLFTVLGAILMLIYHYMPWLWNVLPMHEHVHK